MDKILKEINKARNIAIVGHLGPDPDSVSSVLLAYNILKHNYPEKKLIPIVTEGVTENFHFMEGASSLDSRDVYEVVEADDIDLLVILDVSDLGRVSNRDEMLELIKVRSLPVICIDHHNVEEKEELFAVHLVEAAASTTEILFRLLHEDLKMELPKGGYNLVALGITSDTQNFTIKPQYDYRRSLEVFSKLLDNGVGVANLLSQIDEFTEDEIKLQAKLLENYRKEDWFNFTYIERDDESFLKLNRNSLKKVTNSTANRYLRLTKNKIGFLVYPDTEDRNMYRVSLRSYEEYYNVNIIAKALGGGGHIGSSGADVQASSALEAVEKVKDDFESLKEEVNVANIH